MTDDILISSEKLSVGYGRKIIVNGVDCEVRQGEILTLIGPNGTGKSSWRQHSALWKDERLKWRRIISSIKTKHSNQACLCRWMERCLLQMPINAS